MKRILITGCILIGFTALGRTGMEARRDNNFTFTMKVNPGAVNILMLTCIGNDRDRKFDVLSE